MTIKPISRRHLARLVAALVPAWSGLAAAQSLDQGIGGTGVVGDPKDDPSDQGIGGTGVVGTIRRFGSIYVNGLRIAYPESLPVWSDGVRAGTGSLKLGQVVAVATQPGQTGLVARSITVTHEVVGPIEAVTADGMTVLGQRVSLADAPASPPLDVGRSVAVSGLRRLDGTIVASLIEPAAPNAYRVAGPLRLSPRGVPTIGNLAVTHVSRSLIGQRVEVTGRLAGATLVATRTVTARTMLARLDTARISLEAYVASGASGLRLGSGLPVDGTVAAKDEEQLVVLTIETERNRLVATQIRAETPSRSRSEEAPARADESKRSPGHTQGGGRGGGRGGRR